MHIMKFDVLLRLHSLYSCSVQRNPNIVSYKWVGGLGWDGVRYKTPYAANKQEQRKLTNANNIPVFGMEAYSADRVTCARGDCSTRGDHLSTYSYATLYKNTPKYCAPSEKSWLCCQGLKLQFCNRLHQIVHSFNLFLPFAISMFPPTFPFSQKK